MCGIFGSEARDRVAPMLNAMRYRGPDRLEEARIGGFSLGVARLAIADPFSPFAKQPHVTEKSRVLAFNGEIYNYRDLARANKTEVVLLGEMLDASIDPREVADGDYAIAYYDPSDHLLHLYRDRWGACPLYYQLHPRVEVSSERRRLQNPRTVPVHSHLVIDVRRRRLVKCDQSMRQFGVVNSLDPALLLQPLIDAVESRVAHGVCNKTVSLSGGMDSAAILLANAQRGSVGVDEAITVALRDDSDELRIAYDVARACKIGWKPILLDPEQIIEEAAEVFEHLDHPRWLPGAIKWRAAVRSWYVAKNATNRVVLTGDGADELFGGYPPWTNIYATKPLPLTRHQMNAYRSLAPFNLDRANKMGMRWSKEFRAPMLSSTFSYLALASRKEPFKQSLWRLLSEMGAPDSLLDRKEKWGTEEKDIDALYPLAAERMRAHLLQRSRKGEDA